MSSRSATIETPAEPEVRTPRPPADPALEHLRRNHALGIVAGAIGKPGYSFLNGELVIAGLIYALTESPMLVALVTIISKGGALAPQLLAGGLIEHRRWRMPLFVAITWVRAVSYALLLAGMWALSVEINALSLTLFFCAYAGTCVAGGTASVVFMDMAGRMIPPNRLGSYFGGRNMLGNLLAAIAGLAIMHPVLETVEVPWNYILLAAMGGTLAILDMWVFSRCRETEGPRAPRRTTLGESIRRGMRWVRHDANYRKYLGIRAAFRVNYLSLAFFIPFGSRALRGRSPTEMALLGGVMVATIQLSRVLASALWGKVADRRGFRASLIAGGAFFAIGPALALLAAAAPQAYSLPVVPGVVLDLPLTIYLVALMAIGSGLQASMIGGNHFIVSMAPPDRRATYVAFANTVTSPLTLLPLAGAALAGAVGLWLVFVAAIAGGVVAVFVALRMVGVRPGETTNGVAPEG